MSSNDLDGLEEAPFSKEEVDAVVRDLPSDKSPDGFSSNFMKKGHTQCRKFPFCVGSGEGC